MAIIGQEVSAEPWIEIPDQRARDLQALAADSAVPGRAPREGARHPGADLLQVRGRIAGGLAQAEHRRARRPTTTPRRASSGSRPRPAPGQWGSALAFAGGLFGLEVTVYMVKVSYQQKPYRRAMMETWGAKVSASPTDRTEFGRERPRQGPRLAGQPRHRHLRGGRGRRRRATTANYSLGSVVNHVLLHQTVIGQEAKKQMEMAGAYPDVVIGCVGGGSNFAGLAYPFLARQARRATPRRASSPPSRRPARR